MPADQPPQLAVIGEALIDLIDHDDSPYLAHAGGGPLNIAVGLARLGRPTALLARLSGDPLGIVLRAHAARSGVDLSLAVAAVEPSTVALLQLRDTVADYTFGVAGTADFQWTDAELDVLPDSVQAVHFGSLASWLPPGSAAIQRLVYRLHQQGRVLLSYDPNIRPALQPDRAVARDQVETAVAAAQLVKASQDDLAWLYPDQEIAAVARRWLARGPSLVVVTRAAAGAIAFASAGEPLVQPVAPGLVVDTVGAGDAFMSGLLDGLARADLLNPQRLRAAPRTRLATALAQAAVVSAITCSRAGASPPWAAELAARESR